MSRRVLAALVRKDLLVFRADRRAVMLSFILPIALASFLGFLFGGREGAAASKIDVRFVDLDHSALSADVGARLRSDPALQVEAASEAAARDAVERGKVGVALVLPAGFGAQAPRALAGGGARPELRLLYDPSRVAERALVEGAATRQVMRALSTAVRGDAGDDEPHLPFVVRATEVTAGEEAHYDGYGHAFAGMGVQFVLMSALESALVLLTQRQRGVWKRLRAAPLSRSMLLGSRALSGAIIAAVMLFTLFAFGALVFKVQVAGSIAGFVAVCLATALMASAFGLLVAALGKTPEATRGIGVFVVLVVVMLGGAWVPAFLFPSWMQKVTLLMPTRWAVDGMDAMLWRGLGLDAAVAPVAVLGAFTAGFGVLAWLRFRWEEG